MLRKIRRLFCKGAYARLRESRELSKIYESPRYQTMTTMLLGPPIELIDGKSFYSSYKEIFQQGIYAFACDNDQPFILDGGSNIGLSVIYFKRLYPNAQIIAFEPDTEIFKTLKKNIDAFGFQDVDLVNSALWISKGEVSFIPDGADGGHVLRDNENNVSCKVSSVRLVDYLYRNINFLKLDIEGAEVAVILDAKDYLGNIDNIFVEYHSFQSSPQRLDELLHVLREAGFRVQLHTQYSSEQPLLEPSLHAGMDMQMNIFAYRE